MAPGKVFLAAFKLNGNKHEQAEVSFLKDVGFTN